MYRGRGTEFSSLQDHGDLKRLPKAQATTELFFVYHFRAGAVGVGRHHGYGALDTNTVQGEATCDSLALQGGAFEMRDGPQLRIVTASCIKQFLSCRLSNSLRLCVRVHPSADLAETARAFRLMQCGLRLPPLALHLLPSFHSIPLPHNLLLKATIEH